MLWMVYESDRIGGRQGQDKDTYRNWIMCNQLLPLPEHPAAGAQSEHKVWIPISYSKVQ